MVGALHRALHRARAAAGADVEAAQAQLVADLLGVVVFVAVIEWPPQHTTRLGLRCGCRMRALRRMSNTASVMPSGRVQVEVRVVGDFDR